MFCTLSQNCQHLFEKWYVYLIVYCSRNSKIALKFRSRPSGCWVIINQNNILTVLIQNLKAVWLIKIPMPFLSSLDNLLYDAYIVLQKKKKKKKVLTILRQIAKHANFLLGVQFPLDMLISKYTDTISMT